MSATQVFVVMTEPDKDCPWGGVCVTRLWGPLEPLEAEELRARLRAEGTWTHLLRRGPLDRWAS